MTVCIYLAHLNPVTNSHVEIIEDLKNQYDVKVMPVIFQKNGKEVNSRSFPFSFEIRKQMLESVFGNSIDVLKNYTFNAPFCTYLPPLISPRSWILRKKILKGLPKKYFTYTGDKAEGLMLKIYGLHPKIGERKSVSASSVKEMMYDEAMGEKTPWSRDVPSKVVDIIKQNWNVVEKYAKSTDETTRVAGMKFPKEGYWY